MMAWLASYSIDHYYKVWKWPKTFPKMCVWLFESSSDLSSGPYSTSSVECSSRQSAAEADKQAATTLRLNCKSGPKMAAARALSSFLWSTTPYSLCWPPLQQSGQITSQWKPRSAVMIWEWCSFFQIPNSTCGKHSLAFFWGGHQC